MDSSGYQSLLDHFGDRAPALYGTWIGLVTIAANCHDRGILRNSRGNPLTISHLSRMTGFDAGLFSELFAWASSPEVGWLETEPAPNTHETTEKAIETPVVSPSSGNSPGDIPISPEKTGGEWKGTRRELEDTNKHTTRENEKVFNPFDGNSEFAEVARQYIKTRTAKHGPAAPSTIEAWYYELARFPVSDAIEILRFSTAAEAKRPITNGDHARARASPNDRSASRGYGKKPMMSIKELLSQIK